MIFSSSKGLSTAADTDCANDLAVAQKRDATLHLDSTCGYQSIAPVVDSRLNLSGWLLKPERAPRLPLAEIDTRELIGGNNPKE
jgi:hypothetical protein